MPLLIGMVFDEPCSYPLKQMQQLLRRIIQTCEDFDLYNDTTYSCIVRPAVFWPDGRSIGYGMPAHISGIAQEFYAKFRYWGFAGVEDFYSLPRHKRNEFLASAKLAWQEVFGSIDEIKEKWEQIQNHVYDPEWLYGVERELRRLEQMLHTRLNDVATMIKREHEISTGFKFGK